MSKEMTKKEMALTLMSIGCIIFAFAGQSIVLGIVGVAFGIGAIVSYKKE